jgi:hypothetical protein
MEKKFVFLCRYDDDDNDQNNNNNNNNVKVHSISHGRNNITCTTNCKYRTAATLYAPEIWFASSM